MLRKRARSFNITAVNSIAAKRLKEHEAGWAVIKAGQPIAELSFVRIDPPFYNFNCLATKGRDSDLDLLKRSAWRDPNPELVFKNRADPAVEVKDDFFFVSVGTDSIVSIRDMRPIS